MEPRNPNTPNTNQTTSLNTPASSPPPLPSSNHMISSTLQRGLIKNGSSHHSSSACASCKYQRKKCVPDCKLAPYFPPTHQTQFLNTHKLFGVSNILKVVNSLDDPVQKEQAVRTMIYQAEVRANDPVGGCYRLVCELNRKIELYKAELAFVHNQLAVYRAQAAAAAAGVSGDEIIRVGGQYPAPLNGYSNHISHQHLLQQLHENQDVQQQQQQQLQYYNMIQDENQVLPPHDDDDEEALNQLWTMENFGNNQGGVNMIKSFSPIGDHKLQQQPQESFIDPDVR